MSSASRRRTHMWIDRLARGIKRSGAVEVEPLAQRRGVWGGGNGPFHDRRSVDRIVGSCQLCSGEPKFTAQLRQASQEIDTLARGLFKRSGAVEVKTSFQRWRAIPQSPIYCSKMSK